MLRLGGVASNTYLAVPLKEWVSAPRLSSTQEVFM